MEERKYRRRGLWRLLAAVLAVTATVLAVLSTVDGNDTATSPTGADAGNGAAGAAASEPAPEAVAAPLFTVTLFDGTEFSLGEHLADDGRPVFLNLWASWCDPCGAEMPDIDVAAEEHPNVLFLGVAVDDTREAAQTFAETLGVMYPLGADDSGEVGNACPILGLPATFIIDSDGTIAAVAYGQLTGDRIEALLSAVEDGP